MFTRFSLGLLGLLIPLLAWGQAATPSNSVVPAKASTTVASTSTSPATSASLQNLAPTAPVITVAGICANGSTPSPRCSTTVSRKEFDDLVMAIQPQMNSAQRQRLAVLYSQLLVFADAAQREGLEKTPEGQEALHFAELQALSQVLTRKLQGETSKVSADDIQRFYREHARDFEEAALERLFVPRNVQAAGKPVKEEEVQAEMAKLRARAVAGESFSTLQKQAYVDLGLTGKPPETQLLKVRRAGLSSSLAGVFDLQFGVISQPISEATGLYVFRLNSKREMSAQEVAPEIVKTLQAQRLQGALQQITGSAKATFDNTYFGVEPKASSAVPGAAPTVFQNASKNEQSTAVAAKPPVVSARAESSPR